MTSGDRKKIKVNSLIYNDKKMAQLINGIGCKIYKERVRKNLSVSMLAELSNLSVSSISKIETAQCGISLKALVKIAAALDLPVESFLNPESGEKNGESRGERFERITKEAEEELVELILEMAESIIHKRAEIQRREED